LLLFTDSRAPGDWATALGDGESVAGFDDLKHGAPHRHHLLKWALAS
jgi:hypothetical protein